MSTEIQLTRRSLSSSRSSLCLRKTPSADGSPVKRSRPGHNESSTTERSAADVITEVQFEKDQILTQTDQIFFDFSLITEDNLIRFGTREETQAILKAFRGAFAITYLEPFVLLDYHHLPPDPLPLTVAGAPLRVREVEDSSLETLAAAGSLDVEWGELGRGGRVTDITSSAEPANIGDPTRRLQSEDLNALHDAFKQRFGLAIGAISWFGGTYLIEYEGDRIEIDQMPFLIGKVRVAYRPMPTEAVDEPALRLTSPIGRVVDDTSYVDDLRPGVVLSSGELVGGGEVFTSSGIPVKNPAGERFVTVAAHGFPSVGCPVFHPHRNGTVIGTLADKIPGTDIGLMRLRDGLTYSNQAFDLPNEEGASVDDLRDPASLKSNDIITMDSPFSGRCNGVTFGFRSMRLESSEKEPKWITQQWFSTGSGTNQEEIKPGTGGSVVWDEDGAAVGFYRYSQIATNFHLATSMEALIELGFVVESI